MDTQQLKRDLWAELQDRLVGDRRRVYDAFMRYGPATTRRIAELIPMDLLTVRPRTTELFQDGLLEMIDRDGHEGVYAAVRIQDAVRRAEHQARPKQMMLL